MHPDTHHDPWPAVPASPPLSWRVHGAVLVLLLILGTLAWVLLAYGQPAESASHRTFVTIASVLIVLWIQWLHWGDILVRGILHCWHGGTKTHH